MGDVISMRQHEEDRIRRTVERVLSHLPFALAAAVLERANQKIAESALKENSVMISTSTN